MGKLRRSGLRPVDRAYDDHGIGGNAKLIFVIMCRAGNTSGICFLAVDTIARVAGVTRSTVTRKIAELVKSGRLVRIEGREGRATWTYRVCPGGKLGPKYASNCVGASNQNDLQNPKIESKIIQKGSSPPVNALGKTDRLRRTATIGEIARRLSPPDHQMPD